MASPTNPQEQLFISTNSGMNINRDLDVQQQGAVPIAERYAHLLNVLDLHDAVPSYDQIARLHPLPRDVDANYKPTRQQAISRNAAITAEQMRARARAEFYEAYGLTAMLAANAMPNSDAELMARKAYDAFTRRFAGTHKTEQRSKSRTLWTGLLKGMVMPNEVSEEPADAVPTAAKADAEHGLSTREKLIILAEAHDAGFLPTTNEEKNTATAYLDYIMSGKFELGPQSQLIEVGNFHGRHHDFATAYEFSLQAGRSIAHEFGDWLTQAKTQLEDLVIVQQLLHETDNPNLSLAVALNADMLKAIPLVRYIDLEALRAGGVQHQTAQGKVQPRFDVLRTRRNESASATVEGKNKTLEDPYTGERTKAVNKWLKMRLTQIKVGDVRMVIGDAIADQQHRVAFHELVLNDFATQKTNSPILAEAAKVAAGILSGEI